MDIAYYLSELLEQLGEVSVPGLGSFTRVKVDGYYNEVEGRFYPPTSRIEFSTHYVDDDVLTRHIGVRKRISLASSKYFTEKYISNLRQEIMAKNVVFADLGTLYFENGEIKFRPADELSEPVFYGYEPIALKKIEDEPANNWEEQARTEPEKEPETEHEAVEELPEHEVEQELPPHEKPVITEEAETQEEPVEETVHEEGVVDEWAEFKYEAPVVTEEPAEDEKVYDKEEHSEPHNEDEDDFIFHKTPYDEDGGQQDEDEPARSYKWLWITLLLLVIAGGVVFAYIYLKPFDNRSAVKKSQPLIPKDTVDSVSAADTLKAIPGGDTSKKIKPAAKLLPQNTSLTTIDSTKKRYEVIGGEPKTMAVANKMIANYKSIGIDAHIVYDATGPRHKISLGTYSTYDEATARIKELSKKVKGLWPLPINPKK